MEALNTFYRATGEGQHPTLTAGQEQRDQATGIVGPQCWEMPIPQKMMEALDFA
jgi:hypothetical protein